MLGQDLLSAAKGAGHEVLALARPQLDITDARSVHEALSGWGPEVVVNCAAWTDVDGAEAHPLEAHTVNGAGAGNVAAAATACGAWPIHISSDYVFDGAKREPYVESDTPRPLSSYGRSKLAGEQAVGSQAPDRHTIARSSWLFGRGGPCFPATMLRLARERDELRVVDDQVGSPTFTGHLAKALIELASEPVRGTVHLAAAGACSWFEFAREIIASSGSSCSVSPVSTAEFPRPAQRPPYSVLASELGSQVPRLPDWRAGLAEYLRAGVGAR